MSRDRMDTLLKVRDLVEKRRLAEQAAAQRELDGAARARRAAVAARAALQTPAGAHLPPAALTVERLMGIAVEDTITVSTTNERLAERGLELATNRRVQASIERRSVERLAERREEEARAEAAKRDQRRLDEAGLAGWWRRRSS